MSYPHITRNRPFALPDQTIDQIAQSFEKANFTESGVVAALGIKGIPGLKDLSPEEAFRRTNDDTALHTFIRLFVIGASCSPKSLSKAFEDLAMDDLIKGGLLQKKDGKIFGAVKITPIGTLLIAFDRAWEGETVEAPDHVMGPSDSATLLATVMVQGKFKQVLDMGAGCGYLAFLTAKYTEKAIATDLNPRAAPFVEFNAKLNSIKNVEARTGDLFAPVTGEKFDLIISNPPFVISPEDRLVYLNGGMKADAFCQRMAKEAPSYLSENGYFQMQCNWVENADVQWHLHLEAWFQGSNCDTWVLRSSTTDSVAYAKGWMKTGHYHAQDQDARLRAWLEYYREEKISSIGGGVVTMRKRMAPDNWVRCFDGPTKIAGPCDAVVRARMEAMHFLATQAKEDSVLLQSVFLVPDSVRLTQECHPSESGWALLSASIRITEGFGYVEEIDSWFAELLSSCDGKRTLQAAMERTAKHLGFTADEIPAETPEIVRQLVDEGFLIPV
jgi:SAM-dependent methyltransferase